jgi:hypothetical protein
MEFSLWLYKHANEANKYIVFFSKANEWNYIINPKHKMYLKVDEQTSIQKALNKGWIHQST